MKNIFLSASIPMKDRNEKYYSTADITAIRDAVIGLSTIVIPKFKLIWGGHPSITPLIRVVLGRIGVDVSSHVTLYQSNYFASRFPKDNELIENLIITEEKADRDESLIVMRNKMIVENDFVAGVFIGGMEGVEDEYRIFRNAHPSAIALPIASTGAAAKEIFMSERSQFEPRLLDDYAYMSLFRDTLSAVMGE